MAGIPGRSGGARPGAGRKPGGHNRPKPSRYEIEHLQGESPLGYMLRIMYDPSQPDERRDKMALAAAQYIHPKLTASAIMVAKTPYEMTEAELEATTERARLQTAEREGRLLPAPVIKRPRDIPDQE